MTKPLKVTEKLCKRFRKVADKITNNATDAEDCYQEACLKVFRLPHNKGHIYYFKAGVNAMFVFLRKNYTKGMRNIPNQSRNKSYKINIYLSQSVEYLMEEGLI